VLILVDICAARGLAVHRSDQPWTQHRTHWTASRRVDQQSSTQWAHLITSHLSITSLVCTSSPLYQFIYYIWLYSPCP